MVREIRLTDELDDKYCNALAGTLLNEDSFDVLVSGESCRVYKPNGDLLMHYAADAIPNAVCESAFSSLTSAYQTSRNRGISAGAVQPDEVSDLPGNVEIVDGTRVVRRKADGTLSRTNEAKPVNSGIIGYFDRSVRMPYCRQTSWSMSNKEKWNTALPYLQACSEVFREEAPERWEAQRQVTGDTSGDFIIPGTVFTTITVNSNWQTAVHKDAGDYKPGLGVMSVMRAGGYTGAYLVFPKYRVAVDMSTGGVCLADVHEWHGNTPFGNASFKRYQRLSCVMYYRAKMHQCGTAQQELERAKHRKLGDAVDGYIE
jgi:hypothetical protein